MPPSYLNDRLVTLLYDECALARLVGIDLHRKAQTPQQQLKNRSSSSKTAAASQEPLTGLLSKGKTNRTGECIFIAFGII
jgi:hypothetical protein